MFEQLCFRSCSVSRWILLRCGSYLPRCTKIDFSTKSALSWLLGCYLSSGYHKWVQHFCTKAAQATQNITQSVLVLLWIGEHFKINKIKNFNCEIKLLPLIVPYNRKKSVLRSFWSHFYPWSPSMSYTFFFCLLFIILIILHTHLERRAMRFTPKITSSIFAS